MLTFRENMLLVYNHKTPEFLPLIQDMDVCKPMGLDYVNEVPDGNLREIINEDWFGQKWQLEPKLKASNPAPNSHLLLDICDWETVVRFPELTQLDWENRAAADTARWNRADRMSKVVDRLGLWERLFSIMPFVEALCALELEPEVCYGFFSAMADHKIRLHNQYIRHYRPDVICMHDDYGSAQGLFMSPYTWRSLIKPHLKRVIENITSQGVLYEHHCCGYMASIADEIADLGASSWHNVHVSNDVCASIQRFGGRLAFIGGICDGQFCDMDNTTEEQLRLHIRETAEKTLPGMGVVINPGFENHREREEVFIDELLKCGQHFFKEKRPS